MKKIPLTYGKFALVDDDMYKYLNRREWYAYSCQSYIEGRHVDSWYAARKAVAGDRVGGRIKMGCEILGLSSYGALHKKILYINRNGLDNRRENLRENKVLLPCALPNFHIKQKPGQAAKVCYE